MEPTCRRCNAYASLVKAMESQMQHLRDEIKKLNAVEINHEAIATLASEREANARLTNELEVALKKLELK